MAVVLNRHCPVCGEHESKPIQVAIVFLNASGGPQPNQEEVSPLSHGKYWLKVLHPVAFASYPAQRTSRLDVSQLAQLFVGIMLISIHS